MRDEWQPVEVYATFMKLVGELQVIPPERLSDAVNRTRAHLTLRKAITEPLTVNYPVLSRGETTTTVAKASVALICPTREPRGRSMALWREKEPRPAAINTNGFSMVADVHLEPRLSLADHLDRNPGDFLPVTNVSALWIAALGTETHSLQRRFALLNPSSIVSFAMRDEPGD